MSKPINRNGFTLIELVMVIVLLGIVAAFVGPRLGNIFTTNSGLLASKLRADIRYAQNLAMSQNRRYRVYLNTAPSPGSGYAVVNDLNGNGAWGEAGEVAQDPTGRGNLSVTLNAGEYAGITITPAAGATFIEFNSLGAATAAVNITVNPGGQLVAVTDQTGAVN